MWEQIGEEVWDVGGMLGLVRGVGGVDSLLPALLTTFNTASEVRGMGGVNSLLPALVATLNTTSEVLNSTHDPHAPPPLPSFPHDPHLTFFSHMLLVSHVSTYLFFKATCSSTLLLSCLSVVHCGGDCLWMVGEHADSRRVW